MQAFIEIIPSRKHQNIHIFISSGSLPPASLSCSFRPALPSDSHAFTTRSEIKIKKRPLLYGRKWPTVMANGETKDCALSGNALIFKYVPAVNRLHIVLSVNNLSASPVQSNANLCEDRNFSAFFSKLIFIFANNNNDHNNG